MCEGMYCVMSFCPVSLYVRVCTVSCGSVLDLRLRIPVVVSHFDISVDCQNFRATTVLFVVSDIGNVIVCCFFLVCKPFFSQVRNCHVA